jgi:ribosomal protein L37AE/L43A
MTELLRGRKNRNRDNFPASVKTELAKRVNYNCSICDAQTTAAKKGTDASFTIGKAAHITAAAAGGPRYDPTQTSAERRSIHNGIWVCASCGDIIDRDEAEYPVEMLHQLKTAAEQLARDRVGRQRQSGPPVPKTHADIRQAIELFCLSEAARYARLAAYRQALDVAEATLKGLRQKSISGQQRDFYGAECFDSNRAALQVLEQNHGPRLRRQWKALLG